MKRSVLTLQFKQKGLKLTERPAFNGRANFGGKLDGSWLRGSNESRNKARFALHVECSSFLGQQCFQDRELTGKAILSGCGGRITCVQVCARRRGKESRLSKAEAKALFLVSSVRCHCCVR